MRAFTFCCSSDDRSFATLSAVPSAPYWQLPGHPYKAAGQYEHGGPLRSACAEAVEDLLLY